MHLKVFYPTSVAYRFSERDKIINTKFHDLRSLNMFWKTTHEVWIYELPVRKCNLWRKSDFRAYLLRVFFSSSFSFSVPLLLLFIPLFLLFFLFPFFLFSSFLLKFLCHSGKHNLSTSGRLDYYHPLLL